VHVKVDTGMHRAGVHPPEEAAPFVEMARAAGLEVEAVWTHLARAEEDVDTTDRQLDRFDEVLEGLGSRGLRPPLVHAANTAGAILHPRSRLDLVRVGIGLYGLEPAPGLRERLGLLPALEWTSRVASVRRLAAAEPVSYGHRYRLEREAHVATVPVGYADGYPRALSSRADVLIRGARHRVAGTVTMDQILVDCGDEPVETGDEVVLIGAREREEVTAEELAALSGTINYEIVCGIGRRVPREHTA
jgi:alanine racemase